MSAAGGVSVTATNGGTITSHISNSTTSIKATFNKDEQAKAISVGAVVTMNKVNMDTFAYIDDASKIEAEAGDISISASDSSAITTEVASPSVSVSASQNKAMSVSVGFSLARNEIDSDVGAYISNTTRVDADGDITLSATRVGTIDADATASAVAVAASLNSSAQAFSGGGAIAVNDILGNTNAYLINADVHGVNANDSGATNILIDADNTSTIDAATGVVAVGVSGSIKDTSVAGALGISVAVNNIGWDITTRTVLVPLAWNIRLIRLLMICCRVTGLFSKQISAGKKLIRYTSTPVLIRLPQLITPRIPPATCFLLSMTRSS